MGATFSNKKLLKELDILIYETNDLGWLRFQFRSVEESIKMTRGLTTPNKDWSVKLQSDFRALVYSFFKLQKLLKFKIIKQEFQIKIKKIQKSINATVSMPIAYAKIMLEVIRKDINKLLIDLEKHYDH